MLLDRGRGCASSGWGWDPGATKSGISLCFLLLDLFCGYSLAVLGLCLAFLIDLFLLFLFMAYIYYVRWPSFMWRLNAWRQWASRRWSWQWPGLKWNGCRALAGCPVPFSYVNGPTPCQEVLMNPHCHHVKTTLPGAWRGCPRVLHSHGWGAAWAQEAPLWTSPRPWRLPSSSTWHPFVWMWGASRGSIDVELRGVVKDHPPLMWPFVPMCTRPT